MLDLAGELATVFPGPPSGPEAFDAIMRLDGTIYRHHKNRRTFRVVLDERAYFVKIHGHTSWREIVKNGLRGRMPVLDASPERAAIERLTALNVPTVRAVGYGRRGRSPAGVESFIITEDLGDFVHLDEAAAEWADMPDPLRTRLLRQAAREIATIARTMHGAGMNHRDFYLCHFMLPRRDWADVGADVGADVQPDVQTDASLNLHVIDLHRVQQRASVPTRWIEKDIAGVLFSSLDLPLTRRELIRFLAVYRDEPRRRLLSTTRPTDRAIVRKAVRLYRSEHGRAPRLPAGLASSA